MTEKEWLALSPLEMLNHLTGGPAVPRVSDRKLRLLAAACCRAVWSKLNEEGRAAVKAAEMVADGLAGPAELAQAAARVRSSREREADDDVIRTAVAEAEYSCVEPARVAATFVMRPIRIRGDKVDRLILLDILGSPFSPVRRSSGRCPHCQPPRELTEAGGLEACPGCKRSHYPIREAWLTRDVNQLASLAYERPGRMGRLDSGALAALSDALEEAGCATRPALDHLREAGPHYRGCHVLDCILGKQ